MRSEPITRKRSQFYLRIKEDRNRGLNLYATKLTGILIECFHSDFWRVSPKKWEETKNPDIENLWIPADKMHHVDVDALEAWGHMANNFIWLKFGENLLPCFSGDELVCCVATDFNFAIDSNDELVYDTHNNLVRSELGEAEYQLKYRSQHLNNEEKTLFFNRMGSALLSAFDQLPLCILNSYPPIISPIPAQVNGELKLAWTLAKHVANQRNLTFLEPLLKIAKPQIKQLPIEQKISAWKEIFANKNALSLESSAVIGKSVVIVDDLYQSGATMWAYAGYLKRLGAKNICGLVCVKSMSDKDNP